MILEIIEEYIDIKVFSTNHIFSIILTSFLLYAIFYLSLGYDYKTPKIYLYIGFFVFTQIMQELLHKIFFLDKIIIFENAFDDLLQHSLGIFITISGLYLILSLVSPDTNEVAI